MAERPSDEESLRQLLANLQRLSSEAAAAGMHDLAEKIAAAAEEAHREVNRFTNKFSNGDTSR